MTRSVDRVHINGLRGISILVISLMMFDMDMERCSGMMVKSIVVCGRKECNGVKGKCIKEVRLRIKGLLRRID